MGFSGPQKARLSSSPTKHTKDVSLRLDPHFSLPEPSRPPARVPTDGRRHGPQAPLPPLPPPATSPPPTSNLLLRRIGGAGERRGDPGATGTRPRVPRAPTDENWLIVIDKPGGDGASKQQMIDCYVHTLAKDLGSEEKAKRKIYNVSCERYFGFGCEIDEDTSNKLEGIPGVLFVLRDSYVDPEHKDYGVELFVNGEVVQRSPERQPRVEPVPQRASDRPRYNDRTRYTRRRENQQQR